MLRSIIANILQDDDSRNLWLLFASTGLFGSHIRNFLITHGVTGGNGKSLLSAMMLAVVGHEKPNYGTMVAEETFTKKDGDRATKANLNRKRFGLVEEVNQTETLNGNELKSLTGGQSFNARGFRSGKTDMTSHLTLILNMNELAEIYPLDGGVRDRLLKIHFPNRYVLTQAEVNEERGIYRRNTLYSTPEWLLKMRCPMFHILKKFLKTFLNGGRIITLSSNLKEARDQYMIDCDDWRSWFNNIAEKTDDQKKGIVASDLVTVLKFSEYFQRLPKKQQRKSVKKRVIAEIKKHPDLFRAFEERKSINGAPYRCILVGWQFKSESHRDDYSLATKVAAAAAKKGNSKKRKLDLTEISQNTDNKRIKL